MMRLTARQIEWFEEIHADRKAAERTLDIALSHSSNRLTELDKEMKKLWQELAEIHGLELFDKTYTIKSVDNNIRVIEEQSDET
jgi:hypothetical protein